MYFLIFASESLRRSGHKDKVQVTFSFMVLLLSVDTVGDVNLKWNDGSGIHISLTICNNHISDVGSTLDRNYTTSCR